jgi:LPS export ABC transporter permease LptG/LPS export ABC transporter permease LptF
MLKTLDRYVIREILPPLFLSLLIFTFILQIPPVMEQLESLVSKGVSWGIAARILVTLIPQALGLTIPMALLVGLLIGLGRLSGDREAVALLACGVSPYRLLRPVLVLAGVAAAIHVYVMIWAIPDANQTFREITYDVVSKRVENDVHPQVFFEDFPGWVLYARDVPHDGGGWKDVLVADTRKAGETDLYLAQNGRLILDRAKQTVDLVLTNGTRYSSTGPEGREIETYRFPRNLIVSLDPQSVFPRMELQRGTNELSIPDLRRVAAEKIRNGVSPHPELIAIQQKFSFPTACLVFAVIGVALGLTVAREGKVAGFVVGVCVIMVYYMLLFLAEAGTKGFYQTYGAGATTSVAILARWVPNLVLLPFGIVALIWRARWAEGRLPFRSLTRAGTRIADTMNRWRNRTDPSSQPASGAATPASHASRAGRGGRVVVVVRIPRLRWLTLNILDRYISGIYLRTAAISFFALLGIFYISTIIDRSDKLFKGQATSGMLVQLLAFLTPQYIYFVIPIAALLSVLVTFGVLSRTSELSVMKACGISIYRVAMPLLMISILWSGALFGLEQRIMALANRRADALDSTIRGRPPRTFNPLTRRWLVGHDGGIYHYSYFDPEKRAIDRLVIYQPASDGWHLESETFANRAVWNGTSWQGEKGWHQRFAGENPQWDAFGQRQLALETPDYFETEQPIAELMTVGQLRDHINELSASGFNIVPLTVDLQKKLAFPFVTVVMTLLAIPFGMTTGKRGTLYGIGIGIVLALSYWLLSGAFAAVGKAGLLDPVLAGWAPNVIAAGTAIYLLLTART